MMTEISLNVLDVAENSVRANASLIEISVGVDRGRDLLEITIKDNGCGMTEEQLEHVQDPFFTTRTTRKVGLGIPFYKEAAVSAGGEFRIESKVGEGTSVYASFQLSNIDRMPLGDIVSTIHTLVVYHEEIDFLYRYIFDGEETVMDTREFREVLGGISFKEKEVSDYIMEYLKEQKFSVDNGVNI